MKTKNVIYSGIFLTVLSFSVVFFNSCTKDELNDLNPNTKQDSEVRNNSCEEIKSDHPGIISSQKAVLTLKSSNEGTILPPTDPPQTDPLPIDPPTGPLVTIITPTASISGSDVEAGMVRFDCNEWSGYKEAVVTSNVNWSCRIGTGAGGGTDFFTVNRNNNVIEIIIKNDASGSNDLLCGVRFGYVDILAPNGSLITTFMVRQSNSDGSPCSIYCP